MRAFFALAAVGLAAWACGSSDAPDDDDDADRAEAGIDPRYCQKYCNAQANAGTLQGSRDACLTRCCASVPSGCDQEDLRDGSPPSDDADEPGDASTCKIPCASSCCGATEGCGVDSNGKPQCVKTCATGSDCATGCCAPATNANGDPIGPYVCKENNGQAYNCCNGFTTCANPTCCVADTKGNKFCAAECKGSNSQCGVAHCIGYNFSVFNTTCDGPTACGP